jgi:hypothetical protein
VKAEQGVTEQERPGPVGAATPSSSQTPTATADVEDSKPTVDVHQPPAVDEVKPVGDTEAAAVNDEAAVDNEGQGDQPTVNVDVESQPPSAATEASEEAPKAGIRDDAGVSEGAATEELKEYDQEATAEDEHAVVEADDEDSAPPSPPPQSSLPPPLTETDVQEEAQQSQVELESGAAKPTQDVGETVEEVEGRAVIQEMSMATPDVDGGQPTDSEAIPTAAVDEAVGDVETTERRDTEDRLESTPAEMDAEKDDQDGSERHQPEVVGENTEDSIAAIDRGEIVES